VSDSIQDCYEFDPFRVDRLKRRLLRHGTIVPLTPKAFDTLLVLIEHRGQVVEKTELMERIWPGVAVEENNLTQNISALRKALGEKREEPRYILTAPGIGYRFIAPVHERSNEAPPSLTSELATAEPDYDSIRNSAVSEPLLDPRSNWRRPRTIIATALIVAVGLATVTYRVVRRARGAEATEGPNAQIKSIAVLPFKPLTGSETDQYLGVGMADALIAKLSSIKQITVRPTSSIVRYTNSDVDPIKAGGDLGVNSVLDGRVQRVGDRIRVTVQLLRASDGAPLWANKFDEKYTDVFSLEDRISEEVAAWLVPTLTGDQKQQLTRHYTEDTEAYQSYIKGLYYWNKRSSADIKKSISYFEDAILQDANFALAYAGLADSYATLGILDDQRPQDSMPKARSAALKAVELDDGLAEAHAALGYVKHRYEWDFAGAQKEFQRAIELNPRYATAHQWYGWYMISVGRFDDALAEFQQAQQIDPLSLYTNLTLGVPYFYSRNYEKAAEQFKRVSEMNPAFWLAHSWLAQTRAHEGKYDDAMAELQKAAKLSNKNFSELPLAGYIYALAGKKVEARQLLQASQRTSKDHYVPAYAIANIYAALEENDQAFAWLDRAFKERDSTMTFIKVDQRLDRIRSDPRLAKAIERLGVAQ
jgi:DNA-binding winged helix-turn-helix (wHTH) protein/TolB-like protein/Flp pilus assembly protein TadD